MKYIRRIDNTVGYFLSQYPYNALPIKKRILATIEYTSKTVATAMRLKTEKSVVKEILEEYQVNKWYTKIV